jgi:hypothetical protein
MGLGMVLKIIKRALLEFGPPAILAVIWIFFAPPAAPGVAAFLKELSLIFFGASWVWGQLLRITHQQGQAEKMKEILEEVGDVKDTMRTVEKSVQELKNETPLEKRKKIEELEMLIDKANSQIHTANTNLIALSTNNYVLEAETGHFNVSTTHPSGG